MTDDPKGPLGPFPLEPGETPDLTLYVEVDIVEGGGVYIHLSNGDRGVEIVVPPRVAREIAQGLINEADKAEKSLN